MAMITRKRDPRKALHRADGALHLVRVALTSALVVLAVGLLAVLVVIPRLYGGTALTVLTGSMDPTLKPGDVVVVRGISPAEVCSDVAVNQVVTFLPEPNDPTLITHRVISKSVGSFDDGTGCRLVTQGDANSAVDEPVSPAQVRGVMMFGVPKLGWAKQWVQQHRYLALGGVALVVCGWWLLPGRKTVADDETVPATPPAEMNLQR